MNLLDSEEQKRSVAGSGKARKPKLHPPSQAALSISLIPLSAAAAGPPGLDAPVVIGPFLNQGFPEAEPTGANQWLVQAIMPKKYLDDPKNPGLILQR